MQFWPDWMQFYGVACQDFETSSFGHSDHATNKEDLWCFSVQKPQNTLLQEDVAGQDVIM